MPSLEAFLDDLARSRLLPRDELARIRAGIDHHPTEDAVRVAKKLIDQGLLTRYQARKVLAGVTKGFFLGDYKIERRLGEGGMGKVFLGVHVKNGDRVAIKVLPPRRALEQAQALPRFRREMELSRRVIHKGIARTLDVGQDGEVYFMIMEYIPGASLYDMVRSSRGGPLRVPDAARLFQMVAEGLQAAHEAGLIHRDIKPSNLMVTPEGEAKILDLGLAKDVEASSPLTSPNTVIGTLDYASPEQLGNAARADARSDLYSVGCTLYFALTGRAPFEGGDVVNKIYKQRLEDPPPLERVTRGCPHAFAAIVRKLMAKDPAERYQTARELSNDLARWTDPALVKTMIGEAAEAARAFRPPPPILDEEDLRLLPDSAPPLSVLKEFGDAAPRNAPMHKRPPPPRTAVLVPDAPSAEEVGLFPDRSRPPDSSAWLVPFIVSVVAVGLVAILLITFMRH
jgi:serine/threonine-protein kinase